MKRIFVFGNPDLQEDSLPLRLLPRLRERFPEIIFDVLDPNEDWDVPPDVVVIDSVVGIDEVRIFEDMDKFVSAPRVTMHDFDALSNLRYLIKLGKLKKVKIIGVPAAMDEERAVEDISKALSSG